MLVIHAIWAYGALHAWAEDPALPAQAPPRAGRPSRAPRSHPFAVPPGRLADALAAAGARDLARKAVDDELTMHLPSLPNAPLASPELIRPPLGTANPDARPPGRPALAAWRVPVLTFESATAASELTTLGDRPGGELSLS